jgi:hypothetical protein
VKHVGGGGEGGAPAWELSTSKMVAASSCELTVLSKKKNLQSNRQTPPFPNATFLLSPSLPLLLEGVVLNYCAPTHDVELTHAGCCCCRRRANPKMKTSRSNQPWAACFLAHPHPHPHTQDNGKCCPSRAFVCLLSMTCRPPLVSSPPRPPFGRARPARITLFIRILIIHFLFFFFFLFEKREGVNSASPIPSWARTVLQIFTIRTSFFLFA